jgi:hypothetical protein
MTVFSPLSARKDVPTAAEGGTEKMVSRENAHGGVDVACAMSDDDFCDACECARMWLMCESGRTGCVVRLAVVGNVVQVWIGVHCGGLSRTQPEHPLAGLPLPEEADNGPCVTRAEASWRARDKADTVVPLTIHLLQLAVDIADGCVPQLGEIREEVLAQRLAAAEPCARDGLPQRGMWTEAL